MRSKIVSLFFTAALVVACNRPNPSADLATSGAAAAPAPSGSAGADGALYDMDTATLKAPAGSALERILKGSHMRVCVRADVAPFGSFSSSGLQGLEIELANAIVDQISIDYKQPLKVDWAVVAAPDRVKKLQDDACDLLVATLSSTPERATQVSLTKPYLKTDKVLLAAAKVTRPTPVIAKIGGTTGNDVPDVKGTDRVFSSYQDVVYAMDNDEIDYLVTDKPIADQLIRSSVKPYTVSKTLAAGAESYVAAVPNGHPELVAAANKALEDLARSGRLAMIQRRWL